MKNARIGNPRRQRGATLIEVLFAIFIVLMCAMVVSATTPVASMSRFKAEQLNKAAGVAQKELEAIKVMGYSNVTPTQLLANGLIDSTTTIATNTYSFTNCDSTALDNPAAILPSGTGSVLIEQPATDLRRVTITVTWSERGSATRSVKIGTLIANL